MSLKFPGFEEDSEHEDAEDVWGPVEDEHVLLDGGIVGVVEGSSDSEDSAVIRIADKPDKYKTLPVENLELLSGSDPYKPGTRTWQEI
jgi:hypothetical protein